MKLLDRYLLRVFLGALGIGFVAFLILFLTIDFASKITKFYELRETPILPFLISYYRVRIPLFATYILPVTTLFAGAFAMMRLSRANEILPIVTSGTSLRRISAPLLLCAILAGGITATTEEHVFPELSESLAEGEEILRSEKIRQGLMVYGEEGTLFEVDRYDHRTQELDGVRVTQIGSAGRKRLTLRARSGRWEPEALSWRLFDGCAYPFDEFGNPVLVTRGDGIQVQRRDPFPAAGWLFRSEIEPSDFRKWRFLSAQFQTLEELRARSARLPQVPALKVQIHSRYSFPLASLTLLLLALPFVSVARTQSYLRGLFFCFALVFAFYAIHFLLLDYGSRGKIPPLIAAWGATAGFGLIGLILFFRMKT